MKFFNPSIITSKYRANLILSSYQNIIVKGDNVLDIGCGTGVVSAFLKDNLKINLRGCDIKNYLTHSIPFTKIKENGTLPFKKNYFDFVMLNDVLHHLEIDQQTELIEEALRVGKKVLIFEAEPTLPAKLFDIVLNKLHYGDLNAPLTFRSIQGWSKLFKELKVKYRFKRIEKPTFYPFSHVTYYLEKSPVS